MLCKSRPRGRRTLLRYPSLNNPAPHAITGHKLSHLPFCTFAPLPRCSTSPSCALSWLSAMMTSAMSALEADWAGSRVTTFKLSNVLKRAKTTDYTKASDQGKVASSDAPSYLFTDTVDVARARTPGCTKAAVSPAWIPRRPCDRRCVRLQTVTTRPVTGA
jgi:hypothetical protein